MPVPRGPRESSIKGRKESTREGKKTEEGQKIRTERLECTLLTGDLNRGGLPSNLTWSRPCHALALEPLPTEVLLDLVPRHVQLDLDDPRPGTRVDKILVLRSLGPVTVTAKIHLQHRPSIRVTGWCQGTGHGVAGVGDGGCARGGREKKKGGRGS